MDKLEKELYDLRQRVQNLENLEKARLNTWLFGESTIKRSLAVFFLVWLAQIIIGLGLFVILLVLGMLPALLSFVQ